MIGWECSVIYASVELHKDGFIGDVERLYELFKAALPEFIVKLGEGCIRELFTMLLWEKAAYINKLYLPYKGNQLYVWLLRYLINRSKDMDLLLHDLRCLNILSLSGAENDRPDLTNKGYADLRRNAETLFTELAEKKITLETYIRMALISFSKYKHRYKKELPWRLSIICKPKVVAKVMESLNEQKE